MASHTRSLLCWPSACVVAGLLLLPLPSFSIVQAKQPSASNEPTKPQTSATITSNTELVTVPVSVRGKNGDALTGLKKEDFTVLDNGKPRSIAIFEEVHATAPLLPINASDRQTYSNVVPPSEPGATRSTEPLIMVIDEVNTPLLSQTRAKKGVIEYLSSQLDASQPTALLVFTSNGIRQIHAFTHDTQALINAARRVQGNLAHTETELTQEDLGLSDDAPQGAVTSQRVENSFNQRNATRDTLNNFRQVAHAMAGVQGRKSLIWLSSGFPMTIDDPRAFANQGTDLFHEYENTWQLLNKAQIAVYPVNLEALSNPTYTGNSRPARPGMRGALNAPGVAPMPDRAQQSEESLRQFAAATGGRPCINNTNVSQCITKAAIDSRDYYLLAFYVPHDEAEPGWHKLKVKLEQPHGDLQARSKYYLSPPVTADPRQNEAALQNAVASNMEFGGIGFSVRPEVSLEIADPSKGIAERTSMAFRISIPAATLKALTTQETVQLEFLMLPSRSNGDGFPDAAVRLHIDLPPQKAAEALKNGITITQRLALPAGSSQVKFVAMNPQDGSAGSVLVPLMGNRK